MTNSSNGTSVSWTTIASVAGLILVLSGGQWAVFQTELSSVSERIKEGITITDKELKIQQAQLDRRFSQLTVMTEARVAKEAFSQFETNVFSQLDIIRKQLAVLEQTRPTTGELQASNKNSQEAQRLIEERVRAIEQYMLGSRTGTRTP